jgi:hypothetical protein
LVKTSCGEIPEAWKAGNGGDGNDQDEREGAERRVLPQETGERGKSSDTEVEGDDESVDGLLGEQSWLLKVEIDIKDQRDQRTLAESKEDGCEVEGWLFTWGEGRCVTHLENPWDEECVCGGAEQEEEESAEVQSSTGDDIPQIGPDDLSTG